MTSSKEDIFKHSQGTFPRLTHLNYTAWANNCKRILKAILAWDIVEQVETQPAYDDESEEGIAATRDWAERCAKAGQIIYNSCSESARPYIDTVEDPWDQWRILNERLNTTATALGRSAINQQFFNCLPKPGDPLDNWFGQLLRLRNMIVNTPEAINDATFRAHLWRNLPKQYEVVAKIEQHRRGAAATIESHLNALKEEEILLGLRPSEPAASTSAHLSTESNHSTTRGSGRGRGRGARGRGRGGSTSTPRWCHICETGGHTTAQCNFNKKRKDSPTAAVSSSKAAKLECWACGDEGHGERQCPRKKKGEDLRKAYNSRKETQGHIVEEEDDEGSPGY